MMLTWLKRSLNHKSGAAPRRAPALFRPCLEVLENRLVPAATVKAAIWFDGAGSSGGNGIASSMTHAFGASSFQIVNTAQLDTPGFLKANGFNLVIVTRFDANFGTFLDATAAANIRNYVGAAGTAGQGGVAVFTNDLADNLFGANGGDPFDPNLDRLFTNAVQFAANTGHGFIGEFNGAVMAMTANTTSASPIGLLTGSANFMHFTSPPFVYEVGPIGAGNPIDNGITFPFTDNDQSTFRTDITGALANNIVDTYKDNGGVAVLANHILIEGGLGAQPLFNQPAIAPIIHYNLASNHIIASFLITNNSPNTFSGTFTLHFASNTPVNDGSHVLPFMPGSTIQPVNSTFSANLAPHGSMEVTVEFTAGPLQANAMSAFVIPGFGVSVS